MNTTELPFGTQFSPEQVNLRRLLELAQEYTGKANRDLVRQIASEFFAQKNEAEKLAGNTSISLKGYGLLEGKTTIRITETGKMLLSLEDENQLKKAFAKHILLNLNGLVLVDTLRRMELSGEKLTNASINEELIRQGFKLKQTSNNAQVMKEVVRPLLMQFKDQVGNALAEAYCKTFAELRTEIDSKDTYTKGLALEAFAIKVMKIIGLEFIKTRYKDYQIGGAEVDVLFDSTRLLYTRWQVQCKNTNTVTIDMVAKEVGLSHMLKSNAIVIMTTGHLTSEAKKYARRIMEDMNLCILMLQKEDIDSIIENPPCIVDIFNRQSQEAKKIKVLPNG